MKASNISITGNTSLLFKGPFGFGKTLAAASYALDGPIYMSYWDKKSPVELKTFFTEKRFGDKAVKILDNIEFDVYDATNAHEYLNKLISLVTGGCRYTTLVNDSLTFMTQAAANWSLNFGKSDRIIKKIKDILPDFDEYKTETSLISQCIDLSRKLPCHIIWTAHPLARISVEGGGGASMKVSKVNSLVSYGNKVASMAPGGFTEIYHFSQQSDFSSGSTRKKFIVSTEAIGDEFAKSPLLGDYIKEFDITDKLFYEVWKELLNKSQGIETKVASSEEEAAKLNNPFTQQATKWRT